ncbi:putative aromatic aminotransferase Aro8 [Aspergillus tamarii]|uniref:Putative aromatic aminotransferase Aro8 n=1 Tax=Aspergillus tamarii TaxID=41984 RepID=A0A5N6UA59_ASPTM|nr:putative aromatic aminotransferase Aro8 [Aspergillus tamarii]
MQAVHHVLGRSGIRSLGPGAPSPSRFPFYHMRIGVSLSTEDFEEAVASSMSELQVGKYDSRSGISKYDLATALQYGVGTGSKQLLSFIMEHVKLIHKPRYQNWKCILTTGNTSALDTALRIFGDPGDYILVEDHAYPTLFETGLPLGFQFARVQMDGQGLSPAHLDKVLSTWDDSGINGKKKPRLLYTVPTGQNPTGTTPDIHRRRAIYEIVQKHNLYILEDDPYYYIQMPPYCSASVETQIAHPDTVDEFSNHLLPSYLSLDTDGRVFRMDSFSKTFAPGTRLGWVTAAEPVIDKVMRIHEVSVQDPSGFSQMVMFQLLHNGWGHLGWVRWLAHLQRTYTLRRNVLLDACERFLPPQVVRWSTPRGGFFIWLTIDWLKHPHAKHKSAREIEQEIYDSALDRGSLIMPGSWFLPDRGEKGIQGVFFRITFAAAKEQDMREATQALGTALRNVFQLETA